MHKYNISGKLLELDATFSYPNVLTELFLIAFSFVCWTASYQRYRNEQYRAAMSVLGPILFAIFISCTSDSTKTKLYADDVKLYLSGVSSTSFTALDAIWDLQMDWAWQVRISISTCNPSRFNNKNQNHLHFRI